MSFLNGLKYAIIKRMACVFTAPAAPLVLLAAFSAFAFACAPILPAHAQASQRKQLQKQLQNEITLSASVGIDNAFFPQHMNPVVVTVNNGTSANFEGEILVEAAGRQYRVLNVFVGPLSSKKYSVHARFDSYAYQVKISIINSSNVVIYNQDIRVSPNQAKDYFIYCVSETPSFISSLKGIRVSQKRRQRSEYYNAYNYGGYYTPAEGEQPNIMVHTVRPDDMFSNFACYEPYSLVILNGADTSVISREQQRALIEYVRGGGVLMVSYGGFVSRIASSDLAAILPVAINGSEVFDGSDFYRYAASQSADGVMSEKFAGLRIPLSVGELRVGAGATLNFTAPAGRTIPLIAHAREGNGMVYYTAFDISQVDIGRIDYLKDNVAAILAQSEINKDFKISSVASFFSGYCEKFNQFVTTPPSAVGVVFVLIIFAALNGPVFYFFIRKRVNMVWLTAGPLFISASFFIFFNAFDVEFLFDKPLVAELNLQMIDNESVSVQRVTGVSILMPPMAVGEYSVDQGRATLIGNTRNYYSREESEIIINDDMIKLVHPQMNYRFSKYAIIRHDRLNGKFGVAYSSDEVEISLKLPAAEKTAGAIPAPSSNSFESEMLSYLTAALTNKKARRLLSIVNNTDLVLQECKVYYCGHIYDAAALVPGGRVEFSSPSPFDSPRDVENHFDKIATRVCEGLPPKLGNQSSFYGYNGDAFVRLTGLYIARTAASTPVMVGYIKTGAAAGEVVKSSGCEINALGTIAVIKL